jgi:muramoyltetrapeptide carboxypeptidase
MLVCKPALLKPGDKIGIVAPAGCVDDGTLVLGVEAIRKEGFVVELSANLNERKGYLAGDARSRARCLEEFFRRTDIAAILCARGGFGSIQLIPHLHADRFKPKIFAGYSDITVLLNWFRQTHQMVTFHAPMVGMDLARGLTSRSKELFWGTLTGKMQAWEVPLGEVIQSGKAEAEMMGGCLSLLVTTLGTPYEIDTTDKLLFLEDIGEKPYRIERMLTHLKMAGKMDNLAGLVFGDFTDCAGEGPRDVRQIIIELFSRSPYPVLMGLAAGHGRENLTLPFGVRMRLDGEARTLSMLESPVA